MEEFIIQLSKVYNRYCESMYNKFMYELVSQEIRNEIKYIFDAFLRGTDINVKCDEENNPPEIVDQGVIMLRFSKKIHNEIRYIDIPFGKKI